LNYNLIAAFSFSIVLAAITGWIRFKKMDPAFYPFLIMVSLATLNEAISFIEIRNGQTNAINANIYSLAESILIAWQFRKWALFNKKKKLFYLMISLYLVVWVSENVIVFSMTRFSSYFNIIYGFTTVMMSISMLNYLLVFQRDLLITRPIMLICFCFCVFYTYTALIEIFWIWGLDASTNFKSNIYRILYFVNLVTNLTYAFAIIWVPKKREFMVL
jgi:hypothetical protein